MTKTYPVPRQNPQGNWYLAFENASGTHYYDETAPTWVTRDAAIEAAKSELYCIVCGEPEDFCTCNVQG